MFHSHRCVKHAHLKVRWLHCAIQISWHNQNATFLFILTENLLCMCNIRVICCNVHRIDKLVVTKTSVLSCTFAMLITHSDPIWAFKSQPSGSISIWSLSPSQSAVQSFPRVSIKGGRDIVISITYPITTYSYRLNGSTILQYPLQNSPIHGCTFTSIIPL